MGGGFRYLFTTHIIDHYQVGELQRMFDYDGLKMKEWLDNATDEDFETLSLMARFRLER